MVALVLVSGLEALNPDRVEPEVSRAGAPETVRIPNPARPFRKAMRKAEKPSGKADDEAQRGVETAGEKTVKANNAATQKTRAARQEVRTDGAEVNGGRK